MNDNVPLSSEPLPSLIRMMVTAGARHALTGISGALIANGAIQNDQQAQFISIATGIIVWLAGFAWSAMQKKAMVNAVASASPPLNTATPNEAPH